MKNFVPIISALIIGCATIVAALIASNKTQAPTTVNTAHSTPSSSNKIEKGESKSKGVTSPTTKATPKYVNNFPDPSWIVVDETFKTERKAKRKVADLKSQGYTESNFLWVPDFKCLKPQETFLVYIGPFNQQDAANQVLCAYNRKYHKDTYIARISSQSPQSLKCGE